MEIMPEGGTWKYNDGRASFQLGVGFYYDPYFPAFKVRFGLGFWFAGLMLVFLKSKPE
jgi:hypothetical protein